MQWSHSDHFVRMDREFSQPLDVESLARSVHMSGGYFGGNLATKDLDATFAQLEARGADIL